MKTAAAIVMFCFVGFLHGGCAEGQFERPNILVVISDDQSWLHTSFAGDAVVKTPNFDRVATAGVYFPNAFCASPSCSPSRAALLTGRPIWQLQEAANILGPLRRRFTVYPDILESNGYKVGFTGKGWDPGNWEVVGRRRNPAGDRFGTSGALRPLQNMRSFLDSLPDGVPFCFWYGSLDPHSPYETMNRIRVEAELDNVIVPPHIPDVRAVRSRLLDYYNEVERFDRNLGSLLQELERRELLHNTLVIVTSDNGIDLPRGKANLYDLGTRVPFAVMWPSQVPSGREVNDFVGFVDIAPTLLDAAGIDVPDEMVGRSFLDVLLSGESGPVDPARNHVFTGAERHARPDPDSGISSPTYPMRAVRTHDYLYIRNFAPERWPTGPPPNYGTKAHRTIMRLLQSPQHEALLSLAYGRRPAEELYQIREDPFQITNIADRKESVAVRDSLRQLLETYLKTTGDPRISGRDGGWDSISPLEKATYERRFESHQGR